MQDLKGDAEDYSNRGAADTEELAAVTTLEKMFGAMLQAMPAASAASKSSPSKQELATFLLTLRDFDDPGFLAPRLCEHARLLLPLFDPVESSTPAIEAALRLVCPGLESDNDAPVNVDDEERPLVRMMGHTHGHMIIASARDVFNSRAQERVLADKLDKLRTSMDLVIVVMDHRPNLYRLDFA